MARVVAEPKEAPKLPALIRLSAPYGFQTPWGGHRRWEAGEITGYAWEIALLIERGAHFEIVEQ